MLFIGSLSDLNDCLIQTMLQKSANNSCFGKTLAFLLSIVTKLRLKTEIVASSSIASTVTVHGSGGLRRFSFLIHSKTQLPVLPCRKFLYHLMMPKIQFTADFLKILLFCSVKLLGSELCCNLLSFRTYLTISY